MLPSMVLMAPFAYWFSLLKLSVAAPMFRPPAPSVRIALVPRLTMPAEAPAGARMSRSELSRMLLFMMPELEPSKLRRARTPATPESRVRKLAGTLEVNVTVLAAPDPRRSSSPSVTGMLRVMVLLFGVRELSKMAMSPAALGTPLFQLAAAFQLPLPVMFQLLATWARGRHGDA